MCIRDRGISILIFPLGNIISPALPCFIQSPQQLLKQLLISGVYSILYGWENKGKRAMRKINIDVRNYSTKIHLFVFQLSIWNQSGKIPTVRNAYFIRWFSSTMIFSRRAFAPKLFHVISIISQRKEIIWNLINFHDSLDLGQRSNPLIFSYDCLLYTSPSPRDA